MGVFFTQELAETLKKTYFGIIIDETTDVDTTAQLGIMCQYWSFETVKVTSKMLQMVNVKDKTASGLTKTVLEIIKEHNISQQR